MINDLLRLTLHVRVVHPPKIAPEVMYAALVQVYQNAGVQVRLGSVEALDLPEFYDVDAGACPLDGTVSPQLAALHRYRDVIPLLDPVVYFVRSVLLYDACASHTVKVPACTISGDVWPLTMAHEIGHVLGLWHSDDSNNLMYGYGIENITMSPPLITKEQRSTIAQCPYIHRDTLEIAKMRKALVDGIPTPELVEKLSPDSRTLDTLTDLGDPVTASRALYLATLVNPSRAMSNLKKKRKDPRHAVRHLASVMLKKHAETTGTKKRRATQPAKVRSRAGKKRKERSAD